eukprot:666129-Amphidinium_carterae.1
MMCLESTPSLRSLALRCAISASCCSKVDAAFKKLQMRLHPDRFAQASAEVEALAQLHSAKLNEAARTLRSPLLRGRYWMQLKGVRVLEEDLMLKACGAQASIVRI